jgi:hypothetical protein
MTAALQDPQPDLLFALAEISYQRGRDAERAGRCDAITCYYLCAGYAYHYLFDDYRPAGVLGDDAHKDGVEQVGGPDSVQRTLWRERRRARQAFDPRFRLACDLYNAGLAKCIAAAQRVGQLDPRRQLRVPICGTGRPDAEGSGRTFNLSVVQTGFVWKPEEFGPLLFCEDFEVVGLANQHRSYGLGVPLIATRVTGPGPGPDLYPPNVNFPVTAFFRFEGSLADLSGEAGEKAAATGRAGRLELYNPLTVRAVEVAGRQVPLETDLTTPLAYYLAHSRLKYADLAGFLDPDRLNDRTGIYLLDPYTPGKIPVVLVHGLLSSPLTWAPAYNDLQADPVLRRRYQFWVYFYPTADPYLATAADLRQRLARLRDQLDPAHQDQALDEMVFLGHSMGGLVSRLLTVDGGEDFWRLVSDRPFQELKLQEQTRARLEEVFFFHRLPGVRRVVFLGTPHHGSKLSPSLLGRLADRLVHFPRALLDVAREVGADNPDLAGAIRAKGIPSSVDLLAPGSPALEVLAARPRPAGVHYHSVIGVAPPTTTIRLERWLAGAGDEPGDGVVPYRSAHLEDVDSELVVPADHSTVHHHPLALLELRRILLEHARDVDRRHGALAREPARLPALAGADPLPR